MRCDELSDGPARGRCRDHGPAARSATHVERCLRCQAELVQHRRVLRALRNLRSEVLEPAPGMLPELLAALEQAGERSAVRSILHRHRVAYIGGLAAATAAGAAGALVIASRNRTGPAASRA